MPKIVKVRNYSPPNLLENFSSNDISPASGNELGSADKYVYNAGNDLRLWLRFKPNNPEDLVNYDTNNTPTIAYEGTEDTQILTVYSSRMHSARFDNVTNQYAELTFPGGSGNNNILTFGDGATEDLPFSISLWFRKLPESDGTETADYLFTKGKSDTENEYAAWYDPSDDNLHFDLFAAGDISDRQRISVDAAELSDNNWHHLAFTYGGRGGILANTDMNVYIDGVVQPKTSAPSGVYTYMDGVSELLYIGGVYDGGGGHFEADGNMAEFAIWAKELSLEEIKAIYNWTREDSVVKSGYTNLPPRVRLRDVDNRPGCYPTKHRMGDKDRSGKVNIFYEDLPIQFGNKIEDDFKLPPERLFGKDSEFDKTKWVVSAGLSIRKEYRQITDGEYEIDDCAVFSGAGTGGERYIRTKNKIRNPHTISFDLLQGPYNEGEGRLNLKRGRASYSLKLQISTDSLFSTSTTIATYTLDSSNLTFYGLTALNKKPSKTIKLGLKDFPDPGAAYYLRLVQDDYSVNVASWAIRNIKIEYANQNIRYPLNLNYADIAGNKIARQLISLPHTSGTLSDTGRSLKGVSDIANPFQTFEENISPFDETLVVENSDIAFFSQGLDPEIYPGFSSPTKSKTKFTINLSPSEETTFGYINQIPGLSHDSVGQDSSGTGQNLMIFWNSLNKRWEKVGLPLSHNNVSSADSNYGENKLIKTFLTSSCLGFMPKIPFIGKKDGGNFKRFFDASYLKMSNKKTTTYNFPYGPQYNATGSQIVKAKDIGITKPFLLEKCSIEFQSKFEKFSSSVTETDFSQQSAYKLYLDPSGGSSLGIDLIVPTFFILRQFKDNFIVNRSMNVSKEPDNIYFNASSSFSIPGGFVTGQDGANAVHVETNRELLTYGQVGLFMTSSTAIDGADRYQDNTVNDDSGNELTIQRCIDAGLSFDLNIIKNFTDSLNPRRITGSFSMNFESKYSSLNLNSTQPLAYNRLNGTSMISVPNSAGKLETTNQTVRTDTNLKQSRAIVNGVDSYIATKSEVVNSETIYLQDNQKVEKISPFLIMPEDELILGWQYPVMNNPVSAVPGNNVSTLGLYSMTLFGKSKLHLYGSEVVENKEYHETVNQNLTSCAVYEHIIGDEKIIDQWQVSYRGELTGSINSYGVFNINGLFSNNENAYLYAYNSEYVFDVPGSATAETGYRVNDYKKLIPSKRIGLKIFSTTNGKNTLRDMFTSIGADPDNADIFYELLPAVQKHMRFRDQDRVYSDGEKLDGHFYDDSSYGTYNLTDNAGGAALTNHRPKYRFNTKHFGYNSDLLQQGLDSKFERIISTPANEKQFNTVVSTQSPVRTIFVEGKTTEGSEQKIYSRKRLEFLLDDENFQSSNLSTFSTSSIPFIDDNTPRNRTYVTNPVITLTP